MNRVLGQPRTRLWRTGGPDRNIRSDDCCKKALCILPTYFLSEQSSNVSQVLTLEDFVFDLNRYTECTVVSTLIPRKMSGQSSSLISFLIFITMLEYPPSSVMLTRERPCAEVAKNKMAATATTTERRRHSSQRTSIFADICLAPRGSQKQALSQSIT